MTIFHLSLSDEGEKKYNRLIEEGKTSNEAMTIIIVDMLNSNNKQTDNLIPESLEQIIMKKKVKK